ncbi:hypothetical protein HYZ78_00725 [Candidatus Microgenomates bacterium]|nr:hypothetical protein [Candidatus Microgenomates bacterium]
MSETLTESISPSQTETERVSAELTERGIRALENNSDIDAQILRNFKEKGWADHRQHFVLPKSEKASDVETSVMWGRDIADGAGIGAICYERLINWARRGDAGYEMGKIGYKKAQNHMTGGIPDESHIRFAAWDNDDNKIADFDDDNGAYDVARKFVEELEALSKSP